MERMLFLVPRNLITMTNRPRIIQSVLSGILLILIITICSNRNHSKSFIPVAFGLLVVCNARKNKTIDVNDRNIFLSQMARQRIQTINIKTQSFSLSRLEMSFFNSNNNNNDNRFDMKKTVFDLYCLRSIRGDALTKYNTLNQSEPLRINLFLLVSVSLLGLVVGSEDVLGSPLTIEQAIGTIFGSIGTTILFVRECGKRSKQLVRLERELKALDLYVQLPTNRYFADYPYEKPQRVGEVIKQKNARIIALFGNSSELRSSAQMLQVLGNRLVQANTYVTLIVTPDDANSDTNSVKSIMVANDETRTGGRYEWLTEPADVKQWKEFFESTLTNSESKSRTNKLMTSQNSFRWFGLSATGRSFGSGTEPPSWIQVFGKNLTPVQDLERYYFDGGDEKSFPQSGGNPTQQRREKIPGKATTTIEATTVSKAEVLKAQAIFYNTLITGDLSAMSVNVFGLTVQSQFLSTEDLDDDEITSVINAGGRLESWERCLEDGARPAAMKIGNCDCFQVSNDVAYTTAIEFPKVNNSSTITIPTLLAIQKWKRVQEVFDSDTKSSTTDVSENNNRNTNGFKWILQKHQTIVWTTDISAGGTLLCDRRGCVSLIRSA